MYNSKTFLGIDISSEKINLALLRQTKNKINLIKTVSVPTPPEAIVNGDIKDAAVLARVIKEAKNHNKIRTKEAVISLVAKDTLIQIIDLPKDITGNISQYIRNQVKHCAYLPGKDIAFDYCGLPSPGKTNSRRVFVVATKNEKLLELTNALNQVGINIQAIEPSVIAVVRSIYEKRISKEYDSNVLIATTRDNTVTLCVFRNQTLDFIRSKDIEGISSSQQAVEQLAKEINIIIQYYEIDVLEDKADWQIIVAPQNSGPSAENIQKTLEKNITSGSIEIISPENCCQATLIVTNSSAGNISLVALGLALRPMDIPQPRLNTNLLPPETEEVKVVKKDVLITANVTAAIFILMLLTIGAMVLKLKKTNKAIAGLQQNPSLSNTSSFVGKNVKLSGEVEKLSKKLDMLNQAINSGWNLNWSLVLDDIRKKTPKLLYISQLRCDDNAKFLIKGKSLSYEAINIFVELLAESSFLDSATVTQTEKDDNVSGLISFYVDCLITQTDKPVAEN